VSGVGYGGPGLSGPGSRYRGPVDAPAQPGAPNAIYRYEVPVDDQWHDIETHGEIVHVAARERDVVEFWAWHVSYGTPRTRHLRVFGTGHPMDGPYHHRGTALVGPYVWHLMEAPVMPAVPTS
jgi:hypothetical protein